MKRIIGTGLLYAAAFIAALTAAILIALGMGGTLLNWIGNLVGINIKVEGTVETIKLLLQSGGNVFIAIFYTIAGLYSSSKAKTAGIIVAILAIVFGFFIRTSIPADILAFIGALFLILAGGAKRPKGVAKA
jgi:ABC-type long-subunit fatty acid transport system fused permease/ATPase subunit